MGEYTGILIWQRMKDEDRRAYAAWNGLQRRTKKFKLNKPDMTVRQFVFWYVQEQKKLKLKIPSISRLDHSQGYTWDNFFLEEMSSNCKECAERINLKRFSHARSKKIAILDVKDNSVLMICPSIAEAGRATNRCRAYIQRYLNGHFHKPRDFKYALIGENK